MDVIVPIIIFIIFCILFSICGWCCRKNRQGTVYQYNGTPVAITSTIAQPSPSVIPPYPVDPRHPTPQTVNAPSAGFVPPGGYVTSPYPPQGAAPYPPAGGAPYPPADGYPPAGPYSGAAPYPPGSAAAPPPSYSEAVSGPNVGPNAPLAQEQYSKQSPYNPNY